MSEHPVSIAAIGDGSGDPVSQRVIETIARNTDRAIDELPRLYDVVDPEILDGIFAREGMFKEGYLTFEYADHLVTVHADGHIEIEDAD